MCQGGNSFPRGHQVLYSSGFPLYMALEWVLILLSVRTSFLRCSSKLELQLLVPA